MATAPAPAAVKTVSFQLGDRVSDKKTRTRGTVRYVGPVAISYKQPDLVWIGVEWDTDGRGKYDGSVVDKNGVTTRYFECAPTRGSFIKPNKLAARDKMFLDAVREKYLTSDEINSEYRGSGSISISSEWESSHKKFNVELVGIEKIQRHLQLEVIDKVSLENEDVALLDRDPPNILGQSLPNVVELNLENTLISSWADVMHLLHQLPKLERLYLSSNRLQPLPDSDSDSDTTPTFPLKVLVLNNTQTTWQQAVELAKYFPDLEELHLEHNGIDFGSLDTVPEAPEIPKEFYEREETDYETATAPLPSTSTAITADDVCPFPKLHRLNLSHNRLADWSTVLRFAEWPALRHLMLNGNGVSAIAWPDNTSENVTAEAETTTTSSASTSTNANTTKVGSFPALQCISLSQNQISQWTSIDALNRLPSLCALNFEGNPIGGGNLGPRQVRQLLIARVEQLAVLNNSQVRRKERIDAEKMYIKVVLLEAEKSWDAMNEEEKSVTLSKHPRIQDLITTHGTVNQNSHVFRFCPLLVRPSDLMFIFFSFHVG